jgi:cytochrome c
MTAIRRLPTLVSAMLLTGLAACSAEKTAETPTSMVATTTVEAAPPAVPVAADPAPAPVAEALPPVTPATPAGVTLAALTGDAGKGEKIFGQCKTCHVAEKGINRVGPSLWGVVGRPAGSIASYTYSAANKNSGLTWTDTQLFAYLEAPQKVVPGTKMAFAGLKKPQDRADVIAYLKTRA